MKNLFLIVLLTFSLSFFFDAKSVFADPNPEAAGLHAFSVLSESNSGDTQARVAPVEEPFIAGKVPESYIEVRPTEEHLRPKSAYQKPMFVALGIFTILILALIAFLRKRKD